MTFNGHDLLGMLNRRAGEKNSTRWDTVVGDGGRVDEVRRESQALKEGQGDVIDFIRNTIKVKGGIWLNR